MVFGIFKDAFGGLKDLPGGIGRAAESNLKRAFTATPAYTADPSVSNLENRDQLRGFGQQVVQPAMSGRAITAPGAQQQVQLMNRLGHIATGQQQGAGEIAARRQGATAIANQAGQAMGARGIGASAVAANAGRNAAMIGTEVAGRAGEAAMGDQAGANALLGSVAGQNVAQQLQARGMDDAQVMAALDYLARIDRAEQQGRLSLEGLNAQAQMDATSPAAWAANTAANVVPLI